MLAFAHHDVQLPTREPERVSDLTFDKVKAAVLDAGFEVLRAKPDTIQLAARVRSHLMDAGVRVKVADGVTISVVVRGQRSDFPAATGDEIFEAVRASAAHGASARGFAEEAAVCRTLHDPVDDTRVLDVWYELTFSKPCGDLATLMQDLEWALTMPKCVSA